MSERVRGTGFWLAKGRVSQVQEQETRAATFGVCRLSKGQIFAAVDVGRLTGSLRIVWRSPRGRGLLNEGLQLTPLFQIEHL